MIPWIHTTQKREVFFEGEGFEGKKLEKSVKNEDDFGLSKTSVDNFLMSFRKERYPSEITGDASGMTKISTRTKNSKV